MCQEQPLVLAPADLPIMVRYFILPYVLTLLYLTYLTTILDLLPPLLARYIFVVGQ